MDAMLEDDIDGSEELSETERKKIRRIIRDQERMAWLWASLRIWAGWLSAGIIGSYATYEAVAKFFKK